MDRVRAYIQIFGIVQGVGFRPFLHRLMERFSLAGWIRNTSEGVEIEAEGKQIAIDDFLKIIRTEAPPLSRIEKIQTDLCADLMGYNNITILPSKNIRKRMALVSPDVATCPDCLKELNDFSDRRYRFPFINCTNCGPRFSIIRDVPYDRSRTTMSEFEMCADCSREYNDIRNRRYHAQPDCCADCGPGLFYLDGSGKHVAGDPVVLAANQLRLGKIVAIKGLGGIHLACRFDDPSIVHELRRRKQRDEKPLAIMCPDMDNVRKLCHVSTAEEQLLDGHIRPILLLKKLNKKDYPYLSENNHLGIMLPYTPVHHLLMQELQMPLVMTSANLSDLPILIDNDAATSHLQSIADGYLLNNRNIENRCDDSLLWVIDGIPYPVRRSRGYVPQPLQADGCKGGTLACGAEQKASFGLSRGDQVFLSAHIGDLKNAETLRHYEEQIQLFERLFDVRPERIVCDLHPDYLSSEYAHARAAGEALPILAVQHHHAHMASCMLDNRLEGRCIGVIWDGTGYGTDGSIWGGEFLLGDYAEFDRVGSIRPLRLPGGDRAIHEIWRIGASLMLDAGFDPCTLFSGADQIRTLLVSGLNCPASSGMGRLFDGVCAIAGIRSHASYEGQGAVLLEAAAEEGIDECYPCRIENNGMYLFDYRDMIAEICSDRLSGVPAGRIAARFMNTLAEMAVDICLRIRKDSSLNRVVLSGGVFQNIYLLNRLSGMLKNSGFDVYRHSRVSTNDEGISFGQIAIAERSCRTRVPCSTPEDYRN